MKNSKWMLVLGLIVVASMVLAACQPATPAATEAPAAEEPAAEEPAAEEPAAEEPAATSERAPEIRFAVLEDLSSTNVWFLYDEGGSSYWNYVVQSGQWPTLFGLSDQRYDLVVATAADLPGAFTEEDGYFVNTVTLKEGLVWTDGSPVTAEDVAFTANAVLTLGLGLNWQSGYNPEYLAKVEAVDPQTVKYYYRAEPGLSLWQYGALQSTFVSKAYWEPLMAEAMAPLMTEDVQAKIQAYYDGLFQLAQTPDEAKQAEVDALSAEIEALRAPAKEAVEAIDPAGEPTYGPWKLDKWEIGAYAQNVVNDKNFFIGTVVEEYANGAYREYKEDGSYDWSAYGDPTGDMVLTYKAGPYFDTALYSLYDQDAAVLALRNDDVDFLLNPSGLSLGFVRQLESDPSITVTQNPQNGFRYMAFNQNREFFKGEAGVAIRQAVACMLDLDFLTQNVLQGQAMPVYTLVPEGNGFWFNKDVTTYCVGDDEATRVTKAVEILKAAGFTWSVTEPSYNQAESVRDQGVIYGEGLVSPDGTPFPEIELLAPSAGYDPLRATTAIYIEQWMRELGIPVSANLTAFNNITNAVYTTGDYDMFILGWGLSIYPDYICTFFNSGDGTDSYGYTSETLQQQCRDFLLETDLTTAQQMAFDIQNTLATELPYITLFTNPMYDAFRNLSYPYTEVLDGLGSGLYGGPSIAMPVAQ